VEKVEVLCKTIKSENVYVIHEFGATYTTSSLTLLTDKLGRVVPSNQSLRLFDAVPRKALAQEVVGNRLVYGNYLENYDLTTSDGRVSATQSNTATASDPIGTPSVKSGRDYTIGISWLDEFGRESPVLTSSDSSVLIKRKQAAKINKLRASIDIQSYTAPSWATHYKWYIKESKGEYYNLALDRYYNAEDGSVWLSFPSSEINKVREGQHIFLKKEHNSSTSVLEGNKFKILNIEKSVPDYLANKHVPASFAELASDNGATGAFQGFELTENKVTFFGPTADTAQPGTDENNNVNFYSSIREGALIEFKDKNGYGTSKKYTIKSGGPLGIIEQFTFNGVTSTKMAKYEIVLENTIEDTWLTNLADKEEFKAVVYHKEKKFLPEFNGRFFVNVAKTAVLEDKIGAAFTDLNALETDTDFVISPDNMRIDADDTTPDVLEDSTHILWYDRDVDNPVTNSKLPGNTDNFKLFWVDSQGTQSDLPNQKTVKFLHKFVPGVYFKFKYSDGTVSATNYKLVSKVAGTEYNRHHTSGGNDVNSTNVGHGICYTLTIDKARIDTQAGNSTTMTGIRLLKEVEKPDIDQLTSANPAVFETEPLDIADVDLFYEASGKIAKGNITSVADIDWFNCYTFGNGVESNRIRDDFNAPVIGNGVRVNAKLDEPFKETRRGSSMTFGGIINNITNVNNSNQFLTAEDIFKDLNPSYGTIQKLHARNSDLIALCADKVIKILANKDALFEADGRPALTATLNVLGQAVPFAGEYGISNNPESFASYGFRAYFADKARRAVLRLSADGLTVISDKGMRNHFSDRWDAFGNNKIYGSFDERNEVYNVTTRVSPAEQVSFNEAANGWTTRLTYVSEFSGLSLDNQYYTFHEGKIWKHSSANRNNFYDVGYNSSIKVIFNDALDKVKRFTALSYDGGNGWSAEITTSGQTGVVNEWKNKEGLYYNFIKGSSITTTSDFSVQGIGKPRDDSNSTTIMFTNPINVSVQVGDGVYKNAIISAQGTITDISSDRLQLTTGSTISVLTSDFIYVKKPVGTFVSALTGTTATVSMTKAGGNGANNELFSVSAEAFISSE
ncbi:hypothetical protein N8618_00055, partial [bacterium]|nr:hypothetical protein [bacterium]